jgi:hypothetical protein
MLAVYVFSGTFSVLALFLRLGDLSFVLSNEAGETHCHFGITKRLNNNQFFYFI